jgi:Lipoate-protein ligase B
VNERINKVTQFIDLDLIDYQQAWDRQIELFNSILETKSANRNLPEQEQAETKNYLIFCEHPHVFTLEKVVKRKIYYFPKVN